MTGENQSAMSCSEFEALLSDALDGALGATEGQRFQEHAAGCASCAVSYREAETGRNWLAALEEVEPPQNYVRNLLVLTTGREPALQKAARSWSERLGEWGIPGRIRAALVPVYATVRQPRFAMSFGMVFFSFAMMLNIFGIKISDVKRVDLRPAAIKTTLTNTYYQATARAARYYENMRFVLEMRARLRDLQGGEQPRRPEGQAPEQQPQPKPQPGNRNTSGQPTLPANLSEVRSVTPGHAGA